MSEEETDKSQKTEDPTAKKLEDAKKRGQVAVSREINNWIILFVATLIMVMVAPSLFSELKQSLVFFLQSPHTVGGSSLEIGQTLKELLFTILKIMAFPMMLLFFAGLLSPYVQIGPIFSYESLKPSLSKVSIIKGAGRLFSKRSLMEFLKSFIKLVIMSGVSYMMIQPYYNGIEHFVGQEMTSLMMDLQTMSLRLMTGILAVLIVIAIIDYSFQQKEHMEKLMMSKQEIKDEYKQTEGDPMVKAKLRELRMNKARQRMMQAVPEADVVITNPTHYAVALKYNPQEMDAPIMVAKGGDNIALKIKELAKENDVTIVENPALARSLHDGMEIDQIIPGDYYKAVAEVISYVFKLKNKSMN